MVTSFTIKHQIDHRNEIEINNIDIPRNGTKS